MPRHIVYQAIGGMLACVSVIMAVMQIDYYIFGSTASASMFGLAIREKYLKRHGGGSWVRTPRRSNRDNAPPLSELDLAHVRPADAGSSCGTGTVQEGS